MSPKGIARRIFGRSNPGAANVAGAKPRTWLRWLAAGMVLGTLSWSLPLIIRQTNAPDASFVLSYSRNTGPEVWADKITKDPAPTGNKVSDYAVQIAVECRVRRWTIATNEGSTDVDRTAWLIIPADAVDNNSFNCLIQRVRPPFVRLKRGIEPALRDYLSRAGAMPKT